MADNNVIRLGQVNSAGSTDALFLQVFAGETMAQFQTETVFLDKHNIRTIQHGKAASFPAWGRTTATYHTPGTEILGKLIKQNERVITIDDLLISDVSIANIDEAKNHWDVRAPFSAEAGTALARAFDSNVAQVGVLAARASATVTGGDGGSVLTNAAYLTDGTVAAAGLFAANQKLDEKNVPEGDRYAFVKPALYYLMAQTTSLINRDWGGAGVYAEGKILKVASLSIVKTNQLPSTNVTTGPTNYQGNFSTTAALVMNKNAVGTVKLLDLSTEMDYQINRQSTLIVSKYAMGHGILRPECSVELKTS